MFNIQSGVFFHDCENDIKLLRVRLLQRAKMFWTANKLFKALYNYNFDQRSSSYPQCWSILNETNICSTEKGDISFADTWEKCCVPHFDTQVWKSKKYFFDIYSTYTCPYDYFSCEHCYSRVLYPITVDMGLPSFISITKTEKCFGLHRFYVGTAVYFKRALKNVNFILW